MGMTLRNVSLLAGAAALLTFGVLVVNQTAGVVGLATAVDPTLGRVTLWSLVGVYAVTVAVPVVLLVRMPGPLRPPSTDAGPEFATHLARLGERLGSSPHLAGRDLSDRRGVEGALAILDARSDAIAKRAASGVFLATAVSQSGRLDGLVVLAAQSRMVWQIAHVYSQRPTLRDMVHLYANVAGTVFLAGELQEVDLADQVEPILSAALGGIGANVPGFQVVGTVLTNCVLSGSANAFLTLRVGMVAKRTCGALVLVAKPSLRRAASAEAAGHLGAIVASGSARLSKALWKAAAGKVGDAVHNASDYARDAGARLMARVRSRGFVERPESV